MGENRISMDQPMLRTTGNLATMMRESLRSKAQIAKFRAEMEKITKARAGYVDPSPHQNRTCGNCSMFVPDGMQCTLVAGKVARGAWCRRWDPK